MRRFIRGLASLQLTVALVLVLGVVLAAGTIVESLKGTEAGRAVYASPAFYALLALFALNLLAALVDRWPQTKWRIGFAITHLSIVLILAGALLTAAFKIEGQLPIWEGESSSTVYKPGGGAEPESFELPFKVHLDAFELEYYPGTRRPSQFRSRITVEDRSARVPAVIEMNKPFAHAGYRFFQSSYRQERGREMTILSVAKDPGESVVFFGYYALVAGMIVVFTTRLLQARQGAAKGAAVLLAFLASGTALPARAAEIPEASVVERLRELPVQHDGRTMPFDTLAREAVWKVTGKHAWPGIDPVAMAAGWAFDGDGWVDQTMVKLGGGDVAVAAGLAPETRYASFRQLLESQALRDAMRRTIARQEADEKLGPLDKSLLKLEERLEMLDSFFRGTALRPSPADAPDGSWAVVRVPTAAALADYGDSLRAGTPPPGYPSRAAIAREIGYNARRPSRIAWICFALAALASGLALRGSRAGFGRLDGLASVALLAGFAVATWGFAVRWQIAGRIPASDIYESMLVLAWGVALFGVVSVLLRHRLLLFNAAVMATVGSLFTDLVPVDPFIHPMPPVLSGTPWLAIHVPIIVVSYSVFAMATFIGHLVIGVEIFARHRRDLAERWSELLYYYLHVGSILLIAGILTGSIWASSSWGRYWGWDPKEVWSLVAFLAYMAILHARFDQQIRAFGVAASSIAAFCTILMTYLGVNFILATGLHTYGFGSSRLTTSLIAVALFEIAFIGAGWWAHRRRLVAEEGAAST